MPAYVRSRIHPFIAAVSAVLVALFSAGCGASDEARRASVADEAEELHRSIISIDTHSDTPLRMMRKDFDLGRRQDQPGDDSKIDLVRMKEGGLDAVFFAAWVAQGPRTPEGSENARKRVTLLIDSIHAAVGRYPDLAEMAYAADDAARIKARGKRAIYIGIENGYAIGNDLSLIGSYYDRGVRYMTLCHTKNNDICGSSSDPDSSRITGLSRFGADVVREMASIGMLIDISHVSDSAFYDVLAMAPVPVVASHSCARAVCAHDRNMTDGMLRAIASKGGVVQVSLVGEYIRDPAPNPLRDSALAAYRAKYAYGENLTADRRREMRRERFELDTRFPIILPTVSDVVDHIDHIARIAGIDHVGIGSDFDGGGMVRGCFDVSEMKHITEELLRRGYTHEEIGGIWGGNFLRVMRACERYARDHRQ